MVPLHDGINQTLKFSAAKSCNFPQRNVGSLGWNQASQWAQALEHNMLESDNVTADVSW